MRIAAMKRFRMATIVVVTVAGLVTGDALAKKSTSKAERRKEIAAKKKRQAAAKQRGMLRVKPYAPTIAERAKSTELAIKHLGKQFKTYPAQQYLRTLASLARSKNEKAFEAFRYKALVATNPAITFDKILVRRAKNAMFPANWRGNGQFFNSNGLKRRTTFGESLYSFDLKSRTFAPVYKPKSEKQCVMDICMYWDGKKFLYSGFDEKSHTGQVFEMNIDGTGNRRITPIESGIDNYNGIYLPSGKILFCSTATLVGVPCVYGSNNVGNLFEIDPNGKNMHQVCFDQENDWYPYVKENGRVMYHRWEYTDNSHYFTRILMEMNPDGTANRSIYASNSYWPNTLFWAKQIPGHSSKFCAIVSGHHGRARAGDLVLFDYEKGQHEADGALQRIPFRGKPVEPVIIDKYADGRMPMFVYPTPIDENFILVSAKVSEVASRDPFVPSKWGIYLVDTFDNMIQLAATDDFHHLEPVPIKSRKMPPVIPDRRIPGAKDGVLYIQDIYEGPGLTGIPRGTVKAIRIFTYGFAYRQTGAHDGLAIEGGWDTKRVLGTAAVEKDGSVSVRIPHSLPISIQPLDEKGQALQIMRSWLVAQPGETVGCIGCHEPSTMSPLPRAAIAMRKPPQPLKPWLGAKRIYGFGFMRQVQPVLDQYCVGCHDGKKKDRPNFKDTKDVRFNTKAHFSQSYIALHPYVRRPGPESDLHMLTPMEYHAETSELIQLLDKGHHGVKLDAEARLRLVTWIDLNVPFHPTWLSYKNDEKSQNYAKRTIELKKKYAGINDDIEWMPPIPTRPSFVKPPKAPRPAATIKLQGWPLSGVRPGKSHSLSLGKTKLTMMEIPGGQFVMGSVKGFLDESPQAIVKVAPFRMSSTEITNAMFRQFKPTHHSRVLDQQWKDHIYPGYDANKDEMPVIRVSWEEANAFCEWLSAKLKKKVSLPTEAQWEWAARAGSDKDFSFGTAFAENANLADESLALLAIRGVNPRPVKPADRTPLNDFVPRDNSFNDKRLIPDGTGQYKANPFGLHDMHGNVAEWTRSLYAPYPYKDGDGRNDLTKPGKRVVRGGSWRDRPKYATASHRLAYERYQKVYNVGFRVVIDK